MKKTDKKPVLREHAQWTLELRVALDSKDPWEIQKFIDQLEIVKTNYQKERIDTQIKKLKTSEDLKDFLNSLDMKVLEKLIHFNKWPNEFTQEQMMELGGFHVETTVGNEAMEFNGEDCYAVLYFDKFDSYVKVGGWFSSKNGIIYTGPVKLTTPRKIVNVVYE